jgi:fructose-1,6-bisphosphatase/inositol monophosphatase family enzyme
VDDQALVELLRAAAAAIKGVLDELEDWGLAGTKPGQYRSDLAADRAALDILLPAGVGVLSEESGLHEADRDVIVVLDPVDGSTNASRGIPWYATSLAALDRDGARAAHVVNQVSGVTYEAVRGGGATRDGLPIAPTSCRQLGDALIGMSGYPPEHLGWRQMRALGAAALDLCAVAAGLLDAYVDCSRNAHGPWDYLGGMLVCHEAGAFTADARGRDLVTTGHTDRRTPVAAATPELLEQLATARATFP